jgi:hypothetical protein
VVAADLHIPAEAVEVLAQWVAMHLELMLEPAALVIQYLYQEYQLLMLVVVAAVAEILPQSAAPEEQVAVARVVLMLEVQMVQ